MLSYDMSCRSSNGYSGKSLRLGNPWQVNMEGNKKVLGRGHSLYRIANWWSSFMFLISPEAGGVREEGTEGGCRSVNW